MRKVSFGTVAIVLFGLVIVATMFQSAWSKVVRVDAAGSPLDDAGASVGCPACGHEWTTRLTQYERVCRDCGHKFAARMNDNARIVTTPSP